jgi:predicted Fe-Mo cluster-binding NifX family protein
MYGRLSQAFPMMMKSKLIDRLTRSMEEIGMKIGVPSMGDRGLGETVGQHFGMVPFYTIVDTETDQVQVIPNTSTHMGGQGYPPELLHASGVDVLVCGGLGQRAVQMFEERGIRVFVQASGTVEDAIALYQAGKLAEASDENVCREHGHGEGHDHEKGDRCH